MRLCKFLANWCDADRHIHWGLVGDDQFQPCPAAVAIDNVVILFVHVGEQIEVLRLSVEVYVAGRALGRDAVDDAIICLDLDGIFIHWHTSPGLWQIVLG